MPNKRNDFINEVLRIIKTEMTKHKNSSANKSEIRCNTTMRVFVYIGQHTHSAIIFGSQNTQFQRCIC